MKKPITLLLLISLLASLALLPLAGCNFEDEPTETITPKTTYEIYSDLNGNKQKTEENTEKEEEVQIVKEYAIGVIADSQIMPSAAFMVAPAEGSYASYRDHYAVQHSEEFSEAIFNSAIDEYLNSDIKFLLLIGDITNDADPRAIEVVKQGLAKLKSAGIDVYTTLGLCDRYGKPMDFYANYHKDLTAWDADANFKSDFYQFMGAEPYSEDINTLSYAVNVPDSDITIISVDATANMTMESPSTYNVHTIIQNLNMYKYYQNDTDKLIAWLENALLTAQMQNRTPIITSYMPFDEKLGNLFNTSTRNIILTINKFEKIQALCAKYGVKAVFNGQQHFPGEDVYTEAGGNSFQELATGALVAYPLPITTYDLMSNMTFVRNVKNMATLKDEYLPVYTTQSERTALTTDAIAFAKQEIMYAFKTEFHNRITYEDILGKAMVDLGIDTSDKENYDAFLVATNDWLIGMNAMPLYGDNSVESLCAQYNITLPKSDYATILDFMCAMVCKMYDGTLDMTPGGVDYNILKYSMYAGAYRLAEIDIIGIVHNMEPDIIVGDMQPLVDRLFMDDVLDIKQSDLARTFMSVLAIRLNRDTPFKVTIGNTDDILAGLSRLLPIAMSLIPKDYDADTQMIWGIPYLELTDISNGEFYADAFFRSLGYQFFALSCIKYR